MYALYMFPVYLLLPTLLFQIFRTLATRYMRLRFWHSNQLLGD